MSESTGQQAQKQGACSGFIEKTTNGWVCIDCGEKFGEWCDDFSHTPNGQ